MILPPCRTHDPGVLSPTPGALASLSHPPSRSYYERKISEGKRHNQALLCLARRRCDVLYAMIRNGTFYQAPAS